MVLDISTKEVYFNVWGLRIFQILLWAFIAYQFSPASIASYGLWLAAISGLRALLPDGIALGILRSNPESLRSDFTISIILLLVFGFLLGGGVLFFRELLASLFHIKDLSKYFYWYAFLIPWYFCGYLSYRVLQRESKFQLIYSADWAVVVVQLGLLFLANSYSIDLLVLMFLIGEFIKNLILCWSGLRVGKINAAYEYLHSNLGLSFWVVINRVCSYVVAKGDIWYLGATVPPNALAVVVLLKQLFTHVKALLIDPQQELLMPAMARAQNRDGLIRFYMLFRKRLILSGSLLFVGVGLAATTALFLIPNPYHGFAVLALVLGLYQASHLYSFPLAQRSLGAGIGREIAMYRMAIVFALAIVAFLMKITDPSSLYIVAGLAVIGIAGIADVLERLSLNLKNADASSLSLCVLGLGMFSYYSSFFEPAIVVYLLVISVMFWKTSGGKLLLNGLYSFLRRDL